MSGIAAAGIDFDRVTKQLLDEGMQKFVDPYNDLMETLQVKRVAICGAAAAGPDFSGPDDGRPDVLDALAEQQLARRLNAKDASVWTLDPGTARAVVDRLGWLDCIATYRDRVDELADFARAVTRKGLRSVVLLGMGGSSLYPAVCARVFGPADGFPELLVLDSTDPAALSAVQGRIDPRATLFVVASKSGTTLETLSYARHFFEVVRDAGVSDPGVLLGAALGAYARAGRNKVTFTIDELIAPFGLWVEQLLAESTGKDGRGLVLILDEPLGPPELYGDDRLFVSLSLAGVQDQARLDRLAALEQAGHPVVRIGLDDPYDLGAELVRWEMATATAGAVLGVNPFDEPKVTESKRNTQALLQRWSDQGSLGEEAPVAEEGVLSAWPGGTWSPKGAPAALLEGLWDGLRAGDYFAVLAYVEPTDARQGLLQRLRLLARERRGVATTPGFGPRYLHSTGQLHKGGPDTGTYLVLTGESPADSAIPEAPYGFATLLRAQALGDFRALAQHSRRVLRIHIGGDFDAGLAALLNALS